MLAGVKHDGTKHAADRLREARRGILGRRICVGISAVPGWRAAQFVGGQPVDRPGRQRAREDHERRWGLSKIAWKVSHSETKPLSGGSAEIAAQPTRKTKAVCGMRWMRPPGCSMSRSPVLVSTAPAPKNSRLLNTE